MSSKFRNLADVLIKPLVTEKGISLNDSGKYTFRVRLDANKLDVASAVETVFNVRVTSVNIARVKGKVKRYGRGPSKRPDWKKAIVTLRDGERIQIFENN